MPTTFQASNTSGGRVSVTLVADDANYRLGSLASATTDVLNVSGTVPVVTVTAEAAEATRGYFAFRANPAPASSATVRYTLYSSGATRTINIGTSGSARLQINVPTGGEGVTIISETNVYAVGSPSSAFIRRP